MKLDEVSRELSIQFAETESLNRKKQLFCYFLNENKDKEKRMDAPKDIFLAITTRSRFPSRLKFLFCNRNCG